MLKSMLVNKDFLTWLLIGWGCAASQSRATFQNSCQLTWILKWKFLSSPGPSLQQTISVVVIAPWLIFVYYLIIVFDPWKFISQHPANLFKITSPLIKFWSQLFLIIITKYASHIFPAINIISVDQFTFMDTFFSSVFRNVAIGPLTSLANLKIKRTSSQYLHVWR